MVLHQHWSVSFFASRTPREIRSARRFRGVPTLESGLGRKTIHGRTGRASLAILFNRSVVEQEPHALALVRCLRGAKRAMRCTAHSALAAALPLRWRLQWLPLLLLPLLLALTLQLQVASATLSSGAPHVASHPHTSIIAGDGSTSPLGITPLVVDAATLRRRSAGPTKARRPHRNPHRAQFATQAVSFDECVRLLGPDVESMRASVAQQVRSACNSVWLNSRACPVTLPRLGIPVRCVELGHGTAVHVMPRSVSPATATAAATTLAPPCTRAAPALRNPPCRRHRGIPEHASWGIAVPTPTLPYAHRAHDAVGAASRRWCRPRPREDRSRGVRQHRHHRLFRHARAGRGLPGGHAERLRGPGPHQRHVHVRRAGHRAPDHGLPSRIRAFRRWVGACGLHACTHFCCCWQRRGAAHFSAWCPVRLSTTACLSRRSN